MATVSQTATIPQEMEALVLTAPGEFGIRTVPVPKPGPMEVLCRVRAVCICGTDPHIIQGHYKGRWPRAYPFIPGHEWSGEIVQLGPGCEGFGWQVGDRVAGTSHCGCGYCRMCVSGRYNLCENYGREELGHRQYGHYTNGSYATYVVHSVKSVFKIPDSMSFDEAAMMDTTSIALHSVNRAGIHPGDKVAIIGPGPMGILAWQCAAALGAARGFVIGRGERLARAAAFGAEPIDYEKEDPVEAVRSRAGGGVDAAVDCAGTRQAIQWSVDLVRRGGRVALTGVPLEAVELPMQKIVLDELDIFGVRANRATMEPSIALTAAGKIDVKPLITHTFPLSEFEEAYRVFTERRDGALKVIVHP